MITRGLIVYLTPEQRVTRMKFMARLTTMSTLDEFVPKSENINERCPSVFYRLKDNNGGKNPQAPNHGTVWYQIGTNGKKQRRLTSDCVGGMAWCCGFDRYQPDRFSHIYGGWINTDSMLIDARGPAKCFQLLDRPEPGCLIVFGSGTGKHKVGHAGGIIEVPAEWDPSVKTCWDALVIADQASRGSRPGNDISKMDWMPLKPSFLRPVISNLIRSSTV